MKLLLLFLAVSFVAGYALPERRSVRWPVFLAGLLVAVALMSHRFA